MNDTVYYATRGRTYSEIAKGILSLLICAGPFLILLYFGKVDLFSRTGITLMCFSMLLSAMVCFSYTDRAYASIYHPIVRISDEYLILDFDRVVLPWDYIKEVKIVAYAIFLTKKREKWLWNDKTERLGYVPNRKELVEKLIEYCEKYGIPCKAKYLDQL